MAIGSAEAIRLYMKEKQEKEEAMKTKDSLKNSVALHASLDNAKSGGDEPIWSADLEKLKEQYAGHPDVEALINRISVLRVATTGSDKPLRKEGENA